MILMPKNNDILHEPFYIKLGTPTHEANAAATAAMIQAVVAIIDEAQNQLGQPGMIKIKARPFQEGSLTLVLDLIVAGHDLVLVSIPFVEASLEVFKSYVALVKLLKGRSPHEVRTSSEGEIFKIEGSHFNGSTLNVFKNCNVTLNVNNAANEILKDDTIQDVKFLAGVEKEQIAEITREEMPYFQQADEEKDVPERTRTRTVDASLVIRKPVLEGKGKWTVEYEGRSIDVKISHERFLKRVAEGKERFGNGDTLTVELEITDEFDLASSMYIEKKYNVKKVIRHHPHSSQKQKELFPKQPKAESPFLKRHSRKVSKPKGGKKGKKKGK